METTKIALFKGKQIRKTINNNEWWFSVIDVVGVLTDSANPADYIKKMRVRDAELAKGWGQIVTPLFWQPRAVHSAPTAPTMINENKNSH
jgi:DNA-damage-inducible protein D